MIDRNIQPTIRSIDEFNIIKPEHIVMRNDIPLYVTRAGNQDVVRVDIVIGSGRWEQNHPLQALFCNRMLREGSVRLSFSEIAEQLDFYGAWLELSSGLQYSYITLYSLNKYFQQTLSVLSSILFEPTFPAQQLSTVIDNNLQQWRVNSAKVDYLARQNFLNCIFGDNHPSGSITTEKFYNEITRDILLDYYKENYHSGNCSIYLSGNITTSILSQVEDVLGSSPWGEVKKAPERKDYYRVTVPEKRKTIHVDDAMQSCVKIGCPIIGFDHPDSYKLKVLMTVFGGYFGSRLMQNIREDKGYTYGISASINNTPDTGILGISTETANEHVECLIKEVYHEMEVLQNDLIPDSELHMVCNYMLGDMCRTYEGPFAQSDAWVFLYTNHLNVDYFQNSLEAIRSVNPKELRQLAQQYFKIDKMVEVIAGK